MTDLKSDSSENPHENAGPTSPIVVLITRANQSSDPPTDSSDIMTISGDVEHVENLLKKMGYFDMFKAKSVDGIPTVLSDRDWPPEELERRYDKLLDKEEEGHFTAEDAEEMAKIERQFHDFEERRWKKYGEPFHKALEEMNEKRISALKEILQELKELTRKYPAKSDKKL